jgi:hypothetical protein
MVGMRKAAWICIICMFIFLSMLSIISYSTYGDLITTVTVDINEDELAVDVSPGSRGIVTFTGTIDAENYNTAVPLAVDLWAESTVGDAWVSPPTVVFQDDKHSDVLHLTIEVPIGTSASEVHSYTISGIWQQGGRSGDVEGDTCKIIILPYYLPDISCESQYKDIHKGESAIFDILLNNSGNTDDVVRVEIVNNEELKAHGFSTYKISDITIAENTSKEFTLRASTSKDSLDRHSIEVIATSIMDEFPNSDTLILIIRAREINPIETLLDPMVLTIIAVVIIVGIVVFVKKR